MATLLSASLPSLPSAALCCDSRHATPSSLSSPSAFSLLSRSLISHPCTSGRVVPQFNRMPKPRPGVARCAVAEDKEKLKGDKTSASSAAGGKDSVDADSVTRKWGLEAGLWKVLTSGSSKESGSGEGKGSQAKELLARYGGAYLATSITLSAISISLCYALISAGVDVPSLLDKVGIHTDGTGSKVGTFALAYAAHKASSPIRFPPTVALTPIVAGWFGKKEERKSEEAGSRGQED